MRTPGIISLRGLTFTTSRSGDVNQSTGGYYKVRRDTRYRLQKVAVIYGQRRHSCICRRSRPHASRFLPPSLFPPSPSLSLSFDEFSSVSFRCYAMRGYVTGNARCAIRFSRSDDDEGSREVRTLAITLDNGRGRFAGSFVQIRKERVIANSVISM